VPDAEQIMQLLQESNAKFGGALAASRCAAMWGRALACQATAGG
jgi:hypothetical protein